MDPYELSMFLFASPLKNRYMWHIAAYIQQIGRGGRDGGATRAILYYNNSDVASNMPISEAMRRYCRNEGCRREFLMDHFGHSSDNSRPHSCCDNCKVKCDCGSCLSQVSALPPDKPTKGKREVSKPMLLHYFAGENACVKDCCLPQCCTGLSESLAETLSLYESLDPVTVKSEFPYLKDQYVKNICSIVKAANETKL